MSLPQILGLTIIEIIGDFSFKQFSNHGGVVNLIVGILGYVGVVMMLIISLQDSTVIMVNAAWDGISGLIETLCAFVFLGERLDNYLQYFGIAMIASGLYLLKIPWSKNHAFRIPGMTEKKSLNS